MSAGDLAVVASGTGDDGTAATWHYSRPQELKGSLSFPMASYLVLGTHLPGSVIELPRLCQGGRLSSPSCCRSSFSRLSCCHCRVTLLHWALCLGQTQLLLCRAFICRLGDPLGGWKLLFLFPKGSPLMSLAWAATDLPGISREDAVCWRNCSPKREHPSTLGSFNVLTSQVKALEHHSGLWALQSPSSWPQQSLPVQVLSGTKSQTRCLITVATAPSPSKPPKFHICHFHNMGDNTIPNRKSCCQLLLEVQGIKVSMTFCSRVQQLCKLAVGKLDCCHLNLWRGFTNLLWSTF